ncbi:hypothetical protein T492DRAFT_902927 [Pavlovales sp. CCMP2436]|nr:hypothetical protein T492DRAFT_902927 [Pavlovales sp. CCMP2436]
MAQTRPGAQPAEDLNELTALDYDPRVTSSATDADVELRDSYAADSLAHGYDAPPTGESDDARARRVKALRRKLNSLEKRDEQRTPTPSCAMASPLPATPTTTTRRAAVRRVRQRARAR